jgi:dinuclear metal center YbgI/SA1388 family protein
MTTVGDIYNYINEIAPFSLQESYDNSGLCIGGRDCEVRRILVALDCTNEVADEAAKKQAELIVTHHPIIFRAIKQIDFKSTAGKLACGGTSVISAHTSFDSAVMNDILCKRLGLTPIEPIVEENGVPFGCICEVSGISAADMSQIIKEKLGTGVIRCNDEGKPLTRIAVCSGSGGSFLSDVIAKGCDGYITGDVKHDVFIDAHNAGLTVFDAGHYHTENIFCEYMTAALSQKFPDISVNIAETNTDILKYIY